MVLMSSFLPFLNSYHPVIVLAIAAFLDYLIGDPWGWLHPVQIMGWIINHYNQQVWKWFQSPLALRWAGTLLGVAMVLGSGLVGWLIAHTAHQWDPLLGLGVESVLLASCFAGRSLRAAAENVLQPLTQKDLATARSKLSLYVGRDTGNLSEPEILRAVLETVTENATDGVMAPLFYALLGMFLSIGVIPLTLAYKAASTLDSMVGYKEHPYTDLGWFSAHLEDVLTWLPCRLVVLTLAVLSSQPRYVWQICQRDAIADPSPNAGWSECAYAVVLGVQMGGTNHYRGVAKHKPLLGNPTHPITPDRIQQAMQMTRLSFLLWLAIAFTAFVLFQL